jgi:hypothetical protein
MVYRYFYGKLSKNEWSSLIGNRGSISSSVMRETNLS